jgi:hypothetical protein
MAYISGRGGRERGFKQNHIGKRSLFIHSSARRSRLAIPEILLGILGNENFFTAFFRLLSILLPVLFCAQFIYLQ